MSATDFTLNRLPYGTAGGLNELRALSTGWIF